VVCLHLGADCPRQPFANGQTFPLRGGNCGVSLLRRYALHRPGLHPGDLVADAAIELLTAKLRTPLQIERHLTLAFEEGFRVGEKPVTAEVVEAVLSRQLDELEPRLTRHGYSVHTLSEQFNAKPAEIRRLLRGELDPARTRELADEMRAAGLPL